MTDAFDAVAGTAADRAGLDDGDWSAAFDPDPDGDAMNLHLHFHHLRPGEGTGAIWCVTRMVRPVFAGGVTGGGELMGMELPVQVEAGAFDDAVAAVEWVVRRGMEGDHPDCILAKFPDCPMRVAMECPLTGNPRRPIRRSLGLGDRPG